MTKEVDHTYIVESSWKKKFQGKVKDNHFSFFNLYTHVPIFIYLWLASSAQRVMRLACKDDMKLCKHGRQVQS